MASTQSHLMKTTHRGGPFVKDSHDLFATLVISLDLSTHRSFFKSFPNSFTVDEAADNLSSLKFSQSQRSADPKDPSRIITTTTTTTFSMSREMAKGIGQHLIDAHLIENASDLSSPQFKDRGIYMVTPKGLHILERFITKNGISADHTLKLFADQPICMKMLHLERRSADDEIIITRSVVDVLWKRFAGAVPNVTKLSEDDLQAQYNVRWFNKTTFSPSESVDKSAGIVLRKVQGEKKGMEEYQFPAWSAVDWLLDFSTCTGPEEAAEMAAQFVRYGMITLVSDKGKAREGNIIASVKAGGAGGGAGAVMVEAEYRATPKAIYKITREGTIAAKWDQPTKQSSSNINASKPNLHSDSPAQTPKPLSRSAHSAENTNSTTTTPSAERRPSISERLRSDMSEMTLNDKSSPDSHHPKDSHAARLKHILDEPALRSLFREFLRANFCEENLSFWLDVQDFKRRFGTTSSAVAALGSGKGTRTAGHQAMERHQFDLIQMAFVIYNTYLAPASPAELNIDHTMRAELISYMNQLPSEKEMMGKAGMEGQGGTLQASQLQTMVKLYERIQTYIFRLMATDSTPKFVKTEKYNQLMADFLFYENKFHEPMEPADKRFAPNKNTIGLGMSDNASPTRGFFTISQAANEKQAQALTAQEKAALLNL